DGNGAAGGVQGDAGLADRAARGGLGALRIERDPFGGDGAEFTTGAEVDVAPGAERGLGAADVDMVLRGEGGQAGVAVDDEMGLAPRGSVAFAPADAGAGGAAGPGAREVPDQAGLRGDGGELVGGGLIAQAGLLLLRDCSEAFGEPPVGFEYAAGGGGIHLAFARGTGEQQ